MINRLYNFFRRFTGRYRSAPGSYEKFAEVDRSTVMPHGLKIRFDTSTEIRKYVKIGKSCMINADFIFESEKGLITIGDNVHIGGANLISRTMISIGDDVTMAWGITVYDHNSHSIYWEDRCHDNERSYQDYHRHNGNSVKNKDWTSVRSAPVFIGNKVWIGFDATILKGVTIGEGAVVGAKSVVTRDVPPWTVVAGNPAKVVKVIKPS